MIGSNPDSLSTNLPIVKVRRNKISMFQIFLCLIMLIVSSCMFLFKNCNVNKTLTIEDISKNKSEKIYFVFNIILIGVLFCIMLSAVMLILFGKSNFITSIAQSKTNQRVFVIFLSSMSVANASVTWDYLSRNCYSNRRVPIAIFVMSWVVLLSALF